MLHCACVQYMTQWSATFYRLQTFMLVYDLHCLGIAHGDIAPRSVVRTDNGKFLLIDFTESRVHRSKNVSHNNEYVGWCFIVIVLTDIGVYDRVNLKERFHSTQNLHVSRAQHVWRTDAVLMGRRPLKPFHSSDWIQTPNYIIKHQPCIPAVPRVCSFSVSFAEHRVREMEGNFLQVCHRMATVTLGFHRIHTWSRKVETLGLAEKIRDLFPERWIARILSKRLSTS